MNKLPYVAEPMMRLCLARCSPAESLEAMAQQLARLQQQLLEVWEASADWIGMSCELERVMLGEATALQEHLQQWELPWMGRRRADDASHRIRVVATDGENALMDYRCGVSLEAATEARVSASIELMVAPMKAATDEDRRGAAFAAVIDAVETDWAVMEPAGWPTKANPQQIYQEVGQSTFVRGRPRPIELPNSLAVSAHKDGWLLKMLPHAKEQQDALRDAALEVLRQSGRPAVSEPAPSASPASQGGNQPVNATAASPWGRGGEALAASVPTPVLTLDQYAALQAECAHDPHRRAQVQERYGLFTLAAVAALDAAFSKRFQQSPAEHGRFLGLMARYREWHQERSSNA